MLIALFQIWNDFSMMPRWLNNNTYALTRSHTTAFLSFVFCFTFICPPRHSLSHRLHFNSHQFVHTLALCVYYTRKWQKRTEKTIQSKAWFKDAFMYFCFSVFLPIFLCVGKWLLGVLFACYYCRRCCCWWCFILFIYNVNANSWLSQ